MRCPSAQQASMGTSAPAVRGGEQGDRRQATQTAPRAPGMGSLPRVAEGSPPRPHHLDAASQHPGLLPKHPSVTRQARPENSTGAGARRPRSVLLLNRPETSTTIFPRPFCRGCGSAPRIPAPGPEAGDAESPEVRVSRTRPTPLLRGSLKTNSTEWRWPGAPPDWDNRGRPPPRVESEPRGRAPQAQSPEEGTDTRGLQMQPAGSRRKQGACISETHSALSFNRHCHLLGHQN